MIPAGVERYIFGEGDDGSQFLLVATESKMIPEMIHYLAIQGQHLASISAHMQAITYDSTTRRLRI